MTLFFWSEPTNATGAVALHFAQKKTLVGASEPSFGPGPAARVTATASEQTIAVRPQSQRRLRAAAPGALERTTHSQLRSGVIADVRRTALRPPLQLGPRKAVRLGIKISRISTIRTAAKTVRKSQTAEMSGSR